MSAYQDLANTTHLTLSAGVLGKVCAGVALVCVSYFH